MTGFDSELKGQLSIGVAILAVSGAAIFIRFCDSSAVIIAFWRLFFSVLFLIPLIIKKEIRVQFKSLMTWKFIRIFTLSGFFLSLHFFSWFQSLKFTSVAASVIIVNSSPIWVISLSFIIFHEKITKFQLVGLLLVMIGLVFIATLSDPQQIGDSFQEGIILALFGAIMFALYLLIGKQIRSTYTIPNIPYIFIVNFFCTIFLFLIAILLGENVISFYPKDLIWFIALALGPSLLGHALLIYSMKYVSAQTVSLAVIGETVGASLLSWLILREDLTWVIVIGGLFVISGIFFSVKYDLSYAETSES
ncbi:MAG: DMT family transporter [Candidatus Kariarchaeaceae archaeon]|jgi:drug/metabolite transporter (DMT)-like permease